MTFSKYVVFVDESGDHSVASIDPEFPLFVLAFCVFERDYYINTGLPLIKRLKFDAFGHDLAILHERDLRRRTGWFSKISKEDWERLLENLHGTMETLDFKMISVVIDKAKLKAKYSSPEHVYHLALQFGLERICRFLKENGDDGEGLPIICEARGGDEDDDLELAFRRVCDGANYNGDRYPYVIHIADKKCNSEGLQIADLTARPIALSVLRPQQANRAFDALQGKFYRNGYGMIDGFGRKVFP